MYDAASTICRALYPGIAFAHFESIESADASAPDPLSDHYHVGEPSNHGNDRPWAKNITKEWGTAVN